MDNNLKYFFSFVIGIGVGIGFFSFYKKKQGVTQLPFGLNSQYESIILYQWCAQMLNPDNTNLTVTTLNSTYLNPIGYSITNAAQNNGNNSVPYTINVLSNNKTIPYPFSLPH